MEKTVKKTRKPRKSTKVADYEKKIYDLKQLLEISKSLCSVLEYSTLIESILYICMCQMRVLGAGMFVSTDYGSDIFELRNYYSGLDLDPLISYTIEGKHPLVAYLNENTQPYTLPELIDKLGQNSELQQLSSLNPSLIIPLKQKNRLIGILLLGERIDLGEGTVFSEYEKEQISSIASLAAIAINNASLVEMTTTDMMTHLKLKHYFYTVLSDKIDYSIAQNLSLSVLMLDIDHFKNFNDTYGHACGDYVLQEVARIISEGVRTHDLAGRYGGEEFIVMLYNTDAPAAMMVADRIRSNIETNELEYEGQRMNVTISIGVSVLTPGNTTTAKEIVDQADQALYVSKNNGRNRASMYIPEK